MHTAKILTLVLLHGILAAVPASATVYHFGISSIGGPSASQVRFDGSTDSFTFLPEGGGADFVVSASDGGLLDGLLGNISGTFTIGAINTLGGMQTATVSGTGQFSITDSDGFSIAATLEWIDITTEDLGFTLGDLNLLGAFNLSNFGSYAGSNAVLQSFAGSIGSINATFEFGAGLDLEALTADNAVHASSYSGSATVAVSDRAPTLGLLFASGIALCLFRRFLHTSSPRPA